MTWLRVHKKARETEKRNIKKGKKGSGVGRK